MKYAFLRSSSVFTIPRCYTLHSSISIAACVCGLLHLLEKSAHSTSQILTQANNPLCRAGFKMMESHFETDFSRFHHTGLLFSTRPSTMAKSAPASSPKWR